MTHAASGPINETFNASGNGLLNLKIIGNETFILARNVELNLPLECGFSNTPKWYLRNPESLKNLVVHISLVKS